MIKNDDRLLTVFDAEELTGRRAATWRRDILERKIAFVKLGRSVRIPLSEVQRMVKAGWHDPVEGANQQ